MRRRALTALILALSLVVLAATAAWAHPGATVFEISVGQPTSIGVLVPADYGQPIIEVDIVDAQGFQLTGGETPGPGWKLTRTGQTLVFTGGSIPVNYPATVFGIDGVATRKGELLFPVTVRSPNGEVMRYLGGPGTADQGAIVYAGVTPANPRPKAFPWLTVAGAVIMGVGAVGLGAMFLRRRA